MSIDPQDQFASPYVALGNNFVNGVDPDGEFWNFVAGALIGGAKNLYDNRGNIRDIKSGLAYFATGAVGGAVGVVNPIAGARITAIGNTVADFATGNGPDLNNPLESALYAFDKISGYKANKRAFQQAKTARDELKDLYRNILDDQAFGVASGLLTSSPYGEFAERTHYGLANNPDVPALDADGNEIGYGGIIDRTFIPSSSFNQSENRNLLAATGNGLLGNTLSGQGLGITRTYGKGHGNSGANTNIHHGYAIIDSYDNSIQEYGISGRPLNSDGSSPRVEEKIKQKYGGDFDRYKGKVLKPRIYGRTKGSKWEQGKVNSYAISNPKEFKGPIEQKRPLPNPNLKHKRR